jgi:hypothetical protein
MHYDLRLRSMLLASAYALHAHISDDEAKFIDQVKVLLGNRLRPSTPRQQEKAFGQFQAWARAFGYRELPAHGAVAAGFLMAIMSEIGDINQVQDAARAIESVHAARGHFLDTRYLKAAVVWSKDFRAGGECLEPGEPHENHRSPAEVSSRV